MNEIQQYLAEEIAIDCGQGHITRPEALSTGNNYAPAAAEEAWSRVLAWFGEYLG